jgi:hypothetical protein
MTDVSEVLTASTIKAMEAVNTSETLVNFYETTRYVTDDSHLHTRRGESLKFRLGMGPFPKTLRHKTEASVPRNSELNF